MSQPVAKALVGSPFLIACLGLTTLAACQQVVWAEGVTTDQLRVEVANAAAASMPSTLVLAAVRMRSPFLLGRTSNEHAELTSPRLVVRGGLPRVELPGGDRLFVFERLDQAGHGILFVPTSGQVRVVHESQDQLDLPLAIGTDGRHVAYVRDDSLVVVKLDGTFPSGQTTLVTSLPDGAVAESLVVGPTCAFVAVEAETVGGSDRLLRCPFGGAAVDVAPFSAMPTSIEPTLAIAGNGATVAFLREHVGDEYDVWVVGATGPARQIPLPLREYRASTWIPLGEGHTHLLLNGDGSRLLVTEIRNEDELFYADTAIGGVVMHVTGDALFAPYIGSHILPYFQGNRLLVASGHVGWKDWYALQPDGAVANLTQTGSSEPPFLLGSLDVLTRHALGNGTALGTESLGATSRLRRLDPAGTSQVLFTDLVALPSVGTAVGGPPDLRVVGLGGERLVSGTDGSVRLVAPPGVQMTDPVRAASGWRATYAHLPTGLGVLALLLPDGSLLFGGFGVAVPQMAVTAAGELAVMWPERLEVWSATGASNRAMQPAPVRVLLTGIGG